MLTIQVQGLHEARDYFAKLKDGTAALNQMVIVVGTDLPYAYGIETGRTRRGRLARRAGGLHYMRTGAQAIRGQERKIAEAVGKGPAAVHSAGLALGHQVEATAKTAETAVRTGTLRRSIHTRSGRR